MIDIMNNVKIYEVDGTENKGLSHPKITITNHWNRTEFVCIHFPEGKVYTVLAKDLLAAGALAAKDFAHKLRDTTDLFKDKETIRKEVYE